MIKLGGDCVELLRGGGCLVVGIGWAKLGLGRLRDTVGPSSAPDPDPGTNPWV